MGKSQHVRQSDTARLLRIQGELTQFAPLSTQWKEHLIARLVDVVPTQIAFYVQMANFTADAQPIPTDVVATGWLDERSRADSQQWMARDDTAKSNPVLGAIARISKRSFAHRRIELVDDSTWYRSDIVNTVFRVTQVDDNISGVYRVGPRGSMMGVGLYRAAGDRPFSVRDCTIVHLFVNAIGPVYARESARLELQQRLPPRLRQTLEGLMQGESEKQIAYRLGLSRHTVHDYIKELHRRLGVASRAELLLACMGGSRRNGAS